MEKKENINTNQTIFKGYYVQDFKEPYTTPPDKNGVVEVIDLHRVLISVEAPIDFNRWGVDYFGGRACLEISVPLKNICYIFGQPPEGFNLKSTLDSLIGRPVRLESAPNSKGKMMLRGIVPLD